MTEACLTSESRYDPEQQSARDASMARGHHAVLLDQLIGVLAAPLECDDALRQVARLLVPPLADLALIDVVADGGAPERVAVVHATNPALASMLRETASDLQDRAYAPTLTVLRTGSPYLQEKCDPSGLALFLASAELTDEQKEAVRNMQPRSYLAVPLVHRGRCLGAISMLYSAVSDRRYDGGDLAWAQQLAGRVAAAVEIARMEKIARTARARHEQLVVDLARGQAVDKAVVDTVSGPVVVVDALGRIQRFNPVAERLSGYPAIEAVGKTFWQLVPPGEVMAVRATLDALYADGSARHDTFHWLNRAGSRRLVRWAFTPLLGPDDGVAYVVAVGDLTDDVAQQAAAAATADRLAHLHTLAVDLSSAVDVEAVAQTVLGRAKVALGATAGTVMLYSEDGLSLEATTATGYPSDSVDLSVPLSAPVPAVTAVLTGEPILLQSPEESLRAGYAQRADHLQLGHGAWAVVPLKARVGVIGAIGLSFTGVQVFSEDDRAFLLVMAAQCAQAIERAQLRSTLEHCEIQLAEALATLSQEKGTSAPGIALSARELEVLTLLAEGFTNREIAERLAVGADTVKTHVDHVCEKLEVSGTSRSRVLAAVRAVRFGLLPSPTPGRVPHAGDASRSKLLPVVTHVGDGRLCSST